VWADVRPFLIDPREILERLRIELGDERVTEELDPRKAELSKCLAARQAERDRYIRAYAQDHISQDELGVCLADIKNQLDNLRRLLLDSVEGQLSHKREQAEIAITYRFGPPPVLGSAGSPSQGGLFGDALKNGRESITPDIDTPTLTVIAVR
jgi:hypothetical protein